MNYAEMITKALKGRSVYAAAKLWGLNQMSLNRYVRGERLPDYSTALLIAKEAGIDEGEAFKMLAEEEVKRRSKTDKMSTSFEYLLRTANAYWAWPRRVA